MIGVFDSGLGGLSVLAALTEALPHTDFIYFADTAHLPYGNKNERTIQARVLAIGRYLIDQGCTLLVVACNTATAAAVAALRAAHPGLPVVGVEPGVKPAAQHSRTRRIAILATEATSRSHRLAQLIQRHAQHVEVFVEPCPGWATQIETLKLDAPALLDDARMRIEPLLQQNVDRFVLGCTHYSFLAPMLNTLIGSPAHLGAQLVDVATAVARQTQRLAHATPMPTSQGCVALHASAFPEKLHAALPHLHLAHIARRIDTPPQLAIC